MKFMMLILSLLWCFTYASKEHRGAPRIAIIGGGIGGSTTAFKLSRLSLDHDYDISLDLYEAAAIGGRLATSKVNGHEFETGGSIIHDKNQHMTDFVKYLDLEWNVEPPGFMKPVTGFYNGKEFVFISSDSEIWDGMRLLWRYGWDLLRYETKIVDPMLDHFERIYGAQQNGTTFNDVHSLLAYMNEEFPEYLKVGLIDYLRSKGYNDRLIDEVIFIVTNVNYNQYRKIHFFAGSVSLAGSQQGKLRSVKGGNKRVPESLLSKSEARLVKARVESITLKSDSTFALEVNDSSIVYDYVVVACPMFEDSKKNIKFKGFKDLDIPLFEYQETVATLVHGQLNHTFFNFKTPEGLPSEIYSTIEDLFFNCVCVLTPVTFDEHYDKKVFKVFSKEVLTDDQLDLLFLVRDSVTVIPWLAYPLYDTKDKKLPFVLHDNLFYVNTIEWAASAMEMSAISGVNTALHIHDKIKEKLNQMTDNIPIR